MKEKTRINDIDKLSIATGINKNSGASEPAGYPRSEYQHFAENIWFDFLVVKIRFAIVVIFGVASLRIIFFSFLFTSVAKRKDPSCVEKLQYLEMLR